MTGNVFKIHINNIDNKILTLLIVAYYFLTYGAIYSLSFNGTIGWYSGFLLSLIIAAFAIINSGKVISYRECVFYLLILLCHICSIVWNENRGLTAPIQYLRFIFISIALVRVRLDKKIMIFFYGLFCFYFLNAMILQIDPTKLVYLYSRNMISIHLILLLVLLILSCRENTFANNIIICLACIIGELICVWTGCRSAVIALGFLIIFCCVSILKLLNDNKKVFITVTCIIVVFIFGYLGVGYDRLANSEYYLYHITGKESLYNNPRWIFIKEILHSCCQSFGNFVFGPDLSEIPSLVVQKGNPHNAFFQAYANFGLVFFISLGLLLLQTLWRVGQKNGLVLFAIICLIIRSCTDSAAFPGIYDSLYYYFIVSYIFLQDNYSRKERNNSVFELCEKDK